MACGLHQIAHHCGIFKDTSGTHSQSPSPACRHPSRLRIHYNRLCATIQTNNYTNVIKKAHEKCQRCIINTVVTLPQCFRKSKRQSPCVSIGFPVVLLMMPLLWRSDCTALHAHAVPQNRLRWSQATPLWVILMSGHASSTLCRSVTSLMHM